jgi:hypothetical protein
MIARKNAPTMGTMDDKAPNPVAVALIATLVSEEEVGVAVVVVIDVPELGDGVVVPIGDTPSTIHWTKFLNKLTIPRYRHDLKNNLIANLDYSSKQSI